MRLCKNFLGSFLLTLGVNAESLRKKIRKVEKKMRILNKGIVFALFATMAVAAPGEAQAEGKFGGSTTLGTSFNPADAGHSLTGYNSLVLTYATDNWSHATILYTPLQYISGGEFDFDQSHGFLRIQSVRKNLELIDDWSSNLRLRWQLPTAGLAKQGGFGELQSRLTFSNSWDGFSLSIQPSVTLALVDSAYQKYVSEGGTRAGNTLFKWGLETTPAIDLAKGVNFSIYTSLSQSYKGGAPNGGEGSFGDIGLYYEPGISLPIPGPFSWSTSFSYFTSFNEDFSIFDLDALDYNLYISYAW